jgi:hypothetical protein
MFPAPSRSVDATLVLKPITACSTFRDMEEECNVLDGVYTSSEVLKRYQWSLLKKGLVRKYRN